LEKPNNDTLSDQFQSHIEKKNVALSEHFQSPIDKTNDATLSEQCETVPTVWHYWFFLLDFGTVPTVRHPLLFNWTLELFRECGIIGFSFFYWTLNEKPIMPHCRNSSKVQ
jgi:hypothetical protein